MKVHGQWSRWSAAIAVVGLVSGLSLGQSGTRSKRTAKRPPVTDAPTEAKADDSPGANEPTAKPKPEPGQLVVYAQAPLALDGNDPIALLEGDALKSGVPQFSTGFDGLTYRFATAANKARFDQNPEAFAIVLGGNSVVDWKNSGKHVAGLVKNRSLYGGRLYLFADDKQKAAFDADPNAFADADLILQGYSVVGLVDNEALAKGNKEIRAVYSGRVLYFVNRVERAAFLSEPGKYYPSLGGLDPVSAAAEKTAFGVARLSVVYKNRLFCMSSEENRDKFLKDPLPFSDLDVAEGGNCPVALVERQAKEPGHYALTAVFRNHRYLFASEAARHKFLADPSRYLRERSAPTTKNAGQSEKP